MSEPPSRRDWPRAWLTSWRASTLGRSSGSRLRTIDREMLVEYLTMRYVVAPRTIIDGIEKLGGGHFLRVASQAMRRILVEHARARMTGKRGGGRRRLPLEDADVPAAATAPDLLDLDEALTRLTSIHERMGQVVELRYFGGLSVDETADVLGTSPMTVKRDWQAARAWRCSVLPRKAAP